MLMHGPVRQLGAGPGVTWLSASGWKPHAAERSAPEVRQGLKSTFAPSTASPLPGPVPEGPLAAPHQLRSASCALRLVVLSKPADALLEIELSWATTLTAPPPA